MSFLSVPIMFKAGKEDKIKVEGALAHLTSVPVNMTHSKQYNNSIIIIVTIINGKLIIIATPITFIVPITLPHMQALLIH